MRDADCYRQDLIFDFPMPEYYDIQNRVIVRTGAKHENRWGMRFPAQGEYGVDAG
jgi:hypothetical protein